MKIQCDVCDKEEASVFCTADEAALCDSCDRVVHHANKLAGKHLRFSLLHPSFKDSPRCDICQERRAFLFCQEDRAILCRECDIPIHKTNEHTQKHNRFLLTGVKVSASSSKYSSSSSSNGCDAATDSEIKSSVSNQFFSPSSTEKPLPSSTPTPCKVGDHCTSQKGSISTSSISEYLMETLPGWRVEDFLDPSSSPHGFCKTHDHPFPFMDNPFSSEDLAIWIPKAPPQSSYLPQCLPQTGVINGFKGSEEANNVMKITRKWSQDGFTVPQMISPPSFKKSRQFR